MAQDRRRKILDEYFELYGLRSRAEDRLRLKNEYERVVPTVKLSRCPLTGEQVSIPIDTEGIDGLWWDYYDPVRPIADLVETQIALTGAIKVQGSVGNAPFLCKPGPEVPFVVPRLIRNAAVKAVISQVNVGNHVGYPIVYFSHTPSRSVQRFNEWGADRYWVFDDEGGWWDRVDEETESLDFDLGRWVAQGNLFWIAPGDTKLKLQSDVTSCPYLKLEGRRTFLHVQGNQIWEPEPF